MSQPILPGVRASHLAETCSESTDSDTCGSAHGATRAAPGAAATRAQPSSFAPQDVPFGLRFCRQADSIVEGYLCNEPVVVSDACRRSRDPVEQFVCDDLKMQALQKGILEQTWWVVRSLLVQLLKGR
jgi:hypothetical protein